MQFLDYILDHSTLPLLTAFLLGILTMISPCPFCSDVTAISFISKNVNKRHAILWNGMCYVLGKCFSYTMLALVFISGSQVEGIRRFFEHYGEPALGPFLVVIGLIIYWIGRKESHHDHTHPEGETCTIECQKPSDGHHHHEHAPHRLIKRLSASEHPLMNGGLGAFFLGAVFALAFCPYSGLLYFGTLIPLTMLQPVSWSWLMPIMFGLGDAIPVLIIAFILSYGMQTIGRISGNLQKMEIWLRHICVVVFIGFGLYLSISIFSGHHHHDHGLHEHHHGIEQVDGDHHHDDGCHEEHQHCDHQH